MTVQEAPVNYIERTHAWYGALGYGNPYRYAQFDSVPFTPLKKPLAQSRLVLLTSAAPYRPDKGDQTVRAPYNAGAKFYEVYLLPTAQDHDLRVSHVAVQREHLVDDPNCWFPLPALRDAVRVGRLGALTEQFVGVPTNRSQRHTLDVDVPVVLRQCLAMQADVAVLVPNCPVCHQTMSLMARALEANGIATVIMGAARDIVEHAGVPRLLFSDFPLGSAAALPHDSDSRKTMLEQAFRLLEQADRARTTWLNPLRWNGDPGWRRDYLDLTRIAPEELARRRAENDQSKSLAKQLRNQLEQ